MYKDLEAALLANDIDGARHLILQGALLPDHDAMFPELRGYLPVLGTLLSRPEWASEKIIAVLHEIRSGYSPVHLGERYCLALLTLLPSQWVLNALPVTDRSYALVLPLLGLTPMEALPFFNGDDQRAACLGLVKRGMPMVDQCEWECVG